MTYLNFARPINKLFVWRIFLIIDIQAVDYHKVENLKDVDDNDHNLLGMNVDFELISPEEKIMLLLKHEIFY